MILELLLNTLRYALPSRNRVSFFVAGVRQLKKKNKKHFFISKPITYRRFVAYISIRDKSEWFYAIDKTGGKMITSCWMFFLIKNVVSFCQQNDLSMQNMLKIRFAELCEVYKIENLNCICDTKVIIVLNLIKTKSLEIPSYSSRCQSDNSSNTF